MMWPLLFLLALGPSSVQVPPELAQTVMDYWTALARRDKVAAMKAVYPDDLNNFLNRQEPEFKNPKLVNITEESDSSARVTVSIDRFLPNGVFTFDAKDTWVKTDEGWKIRVEPPMDVARRIEKAVKEATAAPLPQELKVTPDQLVFYATNPTQAGILNIVNGLDTPATLAGIQLDTSRLRLVKKPDSFAPGTSSPLEFEYVGPQLKEFNVPDMVTLKIEQQGLVHEFKVTVIYNFMNPIQQWIMKREHGHRASKQPRQ